MARRGRGRYDDWYPRFPRSVPREAAGGIKASSRRGAFGESWWARRWIAVLEGFDLGARLTRGRNYARRGQVTGIEVGEGTVRATVQGSRARPYEVAIEVRTLAAEEWCAVIESLGREAVFAAKLLAGEMPQEIEDVFDATGVTLFPSRVADLRTECSCPDWSNPCKHIAAVYYLLGEEFDRDPFLLFRLRGLERERLAALLGETVGGGVVAGTAEDGGGDPPEPLPLDLKEFWSGGQRPGAVANDGLEIDAPAALLRRLGGFPFWCGEERFLEAFEPIYGRAAAAALEVLAGRTGEAAG